MKQSKVRYSYFKSFVSRPLVLFSAACSVVLAMPAHAQFDRLLQQLQKMAPPQPGGAAPGGATGFPGMPQPGAGNQRAGRGDQGLNICNVHMVATTSRPAAEVERLLLSQFNVAGEQFFNQAFGALSQPRKSDAIPNLQMFSGSMETKRGNALFSTFLAWPEPEVMAEIVAETQNRQDPQIASDAKAILTLVHWAVPGLSREPNAWMKLATEMRSVTHVVSTCLWARLHATGEGGVPVSLGEAVGAYQQCGNIEQEYKTQEPVVKTLDPENYYVAGLLPETLKIITDRHPRAISRLGPYAANLKAAADGMEGNQRAYRQQFVTTPVGRTAIAATQLVSRAEQVGTKVISNSQQMSRTYGDLQANLKQTESGQGNREGEFIPNPAIQQRMAMMAAAAKNAEAPEVAALNEVRQLQGAAAVGLTRARNAVVQEMFASMFGGGGMTSAMKYTRVFQDLDAASVRSCRAYNSFQQAARARNVSTQEDDKSSTSMLGDMMSAK
jgi:hypothetical protein